jgi:hypothetical protein
VSNMAILNSAVSVVSTANLKSLEPFDVRDADWQGKDMFGAGNPMKEICSQSDTLRMGIEPRKYG